jgi:hypothetical protein
MEQEARRTTTLKELEKKYSLGEFLEEVARRHETVTVVLDEGGSVMLQPVPALKPLPALEGSVPEGWKDAIY